MSENKRVHDLMATGIKNYIESLEIAKSTGKDDIAKFCQHQIVNYCSGVHRIGHLDGVMQSLEEMKQNNGSDLANIDKAINALLTEQIATDLIYRGFTQIPDLASGKMILTVPPTAQDQEFAYSDLKDGAKNIPGDFVKPVAENLQTKLEMPELFEQQFSVISSALDAVKECRGAELSTETVQE